MYTELYHFTEKPFNLTPDPKFLFLTPQHTEALASMIYGVKEHRGFISITGEVGTGKTTLIYTLLNNLSEKEKTVFIYHTNTSFKQLLENILLELDIPIETTDKISLLRKLYEYLIHELERDVTVSVIIDEAQNLSKEVMEELRMLSNLETAKTKLLQIVLVGQPELEEKLNSEDLRQLKQRIGIRRQIKPLSLSESRSYIEHRLQLVGSTISKVFTPKAASMICKNSRGIPRNINVLCENAFLIGYSLSKKRINSAIVREVLDDMSGSLVIREPQEITPFFTPSYKMIPGIALLLLIIGTFAFMGSSHLGTGKTAIEESSNQILHNNIHNLGNTSSNATVDPALSSDSRGKMYMVLEKITLNNKETLSYLADKYYGTSNETLIDLLLITNPAITDIDHIRENQQIIIPEITYDSLITQSPDNTYKVHIGTYASLQRARSFYYEYSLIGKQIDIIPRKISDNQTWYRVVVSRYETRDACMETLKTLEKKGLLSIFKKT